MNSDIFNANYYKTFRENSVISNMFSKREKKKNVSFKIHMILG